MVTSIVAPCGPQYLIGRIRNFHLSRSGRGRRLTSAFLLTWTLSIWFLMVRSHLATCTSPSLPKGRTCPSRSLYITVARKLSLVLPLVNLAEATDNLVLGSLYVGLCPQGRLSITPCPDFPSMVDQLAHPFKGCLALCSRSETPSRCSSVYSILCSGSSHVLFGHGRYVRFSLW